METIKQIITVREDGFRVHSAENPHQLYALPGVAHWVAKDPDGMWIVLGSAGTTRRPYNGHTSPIVLDPARCQCAATVRILAPSLLRISYHQKK